jgi:hypothetical protein
VNAVFWTTINYFTEDDLHIHRSENLRSSVVPAQILYLYTRYSSPSIIRIIKSRRMSWARHVALMGEKRNAYRLLVRKPEGKSPLGRPRRRWVYNIRMVLGEVGWSDVD